jgi:hypothetical protein
MRLSVMVVCTLFPGVAAAQIDAAEVAIADADAAASRLDREVACLRSVTSQMRQTLTLMREARAQMLRGESAAVRRDATTAIQSLRQRLVRLERSALACREPVSARARSDEPVEGVVYRDAPVDSNARRVATENPATHVVERDVLLVGNVRAVRGERVDGRGRIDDQTVRDVIRAAASGIDRCYDELVGRGALARGRVVLTFTIASDGRVGEIETEGSTLRSPRFLSCVRGATRASRAATGTTGGDATFSYTLALPSH